MLPPKHRQLLSPAVVGCPEKTVVESSRKGFITPAGALGFRPQRSKEHEIMGALAEKECVPCKGGVPPLKGSELGQLSRELKPGWQVVNEHHLEREFKFNNFRDALGFTNKVGELAEAQGHHPDIYLAWGKVKITLWTHKIDGLTESDFIMAAKVDQL
jgi:4a-hydroxytetrahydrobiopterin dehydratase